MNAVTSLTRPRVNCFKTAIEVPTYHLSEQRESKWVILDTDLISLCLCLGLLLYLLSCPVTPSSCPHWYVSVSLVSIVALIPLPMCVSFHSFRTLLFLLHFVDKINCFFCSYGTQTMFVFRCCLPSLHAPVFFFTHSCQAYHAKLLYFKCVSSPDLIPCACLESPFHQLAFSLLF